MSTIRDEDESTERGPRRMARAKTVIDVDDLTQLPAINFEYERKLKRIGYDTLYEIAEASSQSLAEDAPVALEVAEHMIATAKRLLRRVTMHGC